MAKAVVDRTLRYPPELHAQIEQLAKADGRTVNSYIVRLLQQHADQAMNNLEHVVGPNARAERQAHALLEFPIE